MAAHTGGRTGKPILVEESFATWRQNPKYVKAYAALEAEFVFAAALLQAERLQSAAHAEGKSSVSAFRA